MVASWICIILTYTTFDYCKERFCKKKQKQQQQRQKSTNQTTTKIQVSGKWDHKNVNISPIAFLLSSFVEVYSSAHICS